MARNGRADDWEPTPEEAAAIERRVAKMRRRKEAQQLAEDRGIPTVIFDVTAYVHHFRNGEADFRLRE